MVDSTSPDFGATPSVPAYSGAPPYSSFPTDTNDERLKYGTHLSAPVFFADRAVFATGVIPSGGVLSSGVLPTFGLFNVSFGFVGASASLGATINFYLDSAGTILVGTETLGAAATGGAIKGTFVAQSVVITMTGTAGATIGSHEAIFAATTNI